MIEVTSDMLAGLVVSRTVGIAAIPAPTGSEAVRAGLVAGWWREDGWTDVDVDATGNVWALARPGQGGAVVLAAHLDTVFDADGAHVVREGDGRLLGPGVGDDSVAVAALSAVGSLLATAAGRPVLLLATVGEEGLGNLRGIVAALDGFGAAVEAVLAVEGHYLARQRTDPTPTAETRPR